MTENGSRGGLAVGAGDTDAEFQAHQFTEHFGATDDRYLAAFGFVDFRVVSMNRRRNHHAIGFIDVLGNMPLHNFDADLRQMIGDFGHRQIAAGDDVALIM